MKRESRINSPQNVWITLATTLLLGLLFAQAMTAIPRLSVTFDEDLHISTGYGTLRTGDLRLVEDHPPLIGHLMSWPLLLSPDIPKPSEIPAWEDGDRRLFVRNDIWWSRPIDTWVIPPRIPIALLTLMLGAFLFRWAADWFGPRGGLLALALFAFDPNILAHGTLSTLDLGVTCFIFIAIFGLQRFFQHPSHKNLIIAGAFLGLAMGAKISGFIALPISVGLIALGELRHWWSARKTGQLIKRLTSLMSLYLGTAFLALWAIHLFNLGAPPGLSITLPAPSYWNAFLRVGRHVSRGNPAYLLGETYVGGRWYYFPIVFALKTPLPAIILIGTGIGAFLCSAWQSPKERWRGLVLMSIPVSYFLMSMANQINLGYRHILPIVPFLYLFAPYTLCLGSYSLRTRIHTTHFTHYVLRAILFMLLLWQAAVTLRTWPFYLTYFNEIAGGPENGYRYLADSNVDWGQGLKAIRDYLEDKPWSDVQLSSFTFFIRPELYDVQATPLPPLTDAPPILPNRFDPEPGTYIISTSTLRGLQLVADTEMYNWFWHRQPDDIVANAMLVYHVSEREVEPTWLGQCTKPAIPLSHDAVVEGFGRSDLRMLTFDCTQTWLYPDGGESTGWYVLHREILRDEARPAGENSFLTQRLKSAQITFEQKVPKATPPLTIFAWRAENNLSLPSKDVEEAPVLLDGPLSFLGYETIQEAQTITLYTYWQVESEAPRPFSIMAHLVSSDEHTVAVGDGLGISWEQLQPRDILVERHTLSLPPEEPSGEYQLQTGAYWLETMKTWPVLDGEEIGEGRIPLKQVQINDNR